MKSISLLSGYIFLILATLTGITLIALERQNIQTNIFAIQKRVGPSLVNPSVVFKKLFEVMPVKVAKIKKIYPDNKLILFILPLQILLHL